MHSPCCGIAHDPNPTVCCGHFSCDTAVIFDEEILIIYFFRSFLFIIQIIEITCYDLDSKGLLEGHHKGPIFVRFVYNIAIYSLICFKDKLKYLGVPEPIEPGPGEVEREYLDELAEEEEALVDDLGAEETRENIEELGLGGEEAKLVNGDRVTKFMLLEVSQYICQRRI